MKIRRSYVQMVNLSYLGRQRNYYKTIIRDALPNNPFSIAEKMYKKYWSICQTMYNTSASIQIQMYCKCVVFSSVKIVQHEYAKKGFLHTCMKTPNSKDTWRTMYLMHYRLMRKCREQWPCLVVKYNVSNALQVSSTERYYYSTDSLSPGQ